MPDFPDAAWREAFRQELTPPDGRGPSRWFQRGGRAPR